MRVIYLQLGMHTYIAKNFSNFMMSNDNLILHNLYILSLHTLAFITAHFSFYHCMHICAVIIPHLGSS